MYVGAACHRLSVTEAFVGSEAVRAGRLSGYDLRTKYRAVFPDVYVADFAAPSLRLRSEASLAVVAAQWCAVADWRPRRCTVRRGSTTTNPVELIWRNPNPPVGIVARNQRFDGDEVTRVAGLPVTTVARTAYDLARHLPRTQAMARLDALMHATPFSVEDVLLLAKRYRGARGLRRLRAALPLVDGGAASPKETWLRLVLIDAGLPIPATQIPVVDGYWPVAFLDLGWEQFKVAAEYDGDHHRTDRRQYAKDQRRLRKLEATGLARRTCDRRRQARRHCATRPRRASSQGVSRHLSVCVAPRRVVTRG